MRRRGQAAVLLVALLVPAVGLALVGLAYIGARVQAEHVQRLADTAALRAAMGLPVAPDGGVAIAVSRRGADWAVTAKARTARLHLPLVGDVAFSASATAVARTVTTADGAPGAVLVG